MRRNRVCGGLGEGATAVWAERMLALEWLCEPSKLARAVSVLNASFTDLADEGPTGAGSSEEPVGTLLILGDERFAGSIVVWCLH